MKLYSFFKNFSFAYIYLFMLDTFVAKLKKEVETYTCSIQLISFYFEAIQRIFDSQHEDAMTAKVQTVFAFNLECIKTGISKLRPVAKSGRWSYFIWSQTYFVNNEKMIYLRKICWFGST